MDLFRDRHKIGRCVDEVLAVLFAGAFATIAILEHREIWTANVASRGYALFVLAAGCVLLLLLLLRISAWMGSDADPEPILLRLRILDLSKLVCLHGRDPGWMPARYLILSIPILMIMLGFPTLGRWDPKTEEPEMISVGELFELAGKEQRHAAWQGKKIRTVGRIGQWKGGGAAFGLFDRHRGDIAPTVVGVLIDRALTNEHENQEFRPPVEWGRRIEVIGFISLVPDADDPAKFATVLTVKPSESSRLADLIKPAKPDSSP
jgi:hypothetical protein